MTESFRRADPLGRCFVCALEDAARTPAWYDRPVREVPGVAMALLGVGAIEPGYLLVFPAVHVTSFAQVRTELRAPIVRFVEELRGLLKRHFGPVVLFEHAGCIRDDPMASACVAHAHLHLWGVGDRVWLSLPTGGESFRDLRAFMAVADRYVDEPYLLAQNPDGQVMVGRSNGVPQYFRRQIADQLGRHDEWDYGAFPYETLMSRTLSVFARGA